MESFFKPPKGEEKLKDSEMEIAESLERGKKRKREDELEHQISNTTLFGPLGSVSAPDLPAFRKDIESQKSLLSMTVHTDETFIPLPPSIDETRNINQVKQAWCLKLVDVAGAHYWKEIHVVENTFYNPSTKEKLNGCYDYVIVWDKNNHTLQFRMRLGGHFYLALDENKLKATIDEYKSIHPDIQKLTAKDYGAINLDAFRSKPDHLVVVAAGGVIFKNGVPEKITTKAGCFYPKNPKQQASVNAAIHSFAFLSHLKIIFDLKLATKAEREASKSTIEPPPITPTFRS